MIVAVIENKAILFARSSAQPAPIRLNPQNLALRRPGENETSHVPIDADNERSHRAHNRNLPTVEIVPDLRPLAVARPRILVRAANASLLEPLRQVLRVRPVHRKEKRRLPPRPLVPRLD